MEQSEAGPQISSNQDLRRLILPFIMEQILVVSVGMVDTMMVPSTGEVVTPGASLAGIVNTLFINIFAAMATGGVVVSSQYLGQRRRGRICRSVNQLILIAGVTSLVIMGLCILFRQGVLVLLYGDVTGDVIANALVYLTVLALSYLFLAVHNSRAALFRSMGNSEVSMQASVTMNIVNVVGDALFIFMFRWSVVGVTATSLTSCMIACLILLFRPRNKNLDIFIGGRWKLNLRMVRQILGIDIPNGIENSIFQLDGVLVMGIIAMFGITQVAVNAIANNLNGTGVLLGQVVNLAMVTVVGHCVGAGNLDQVRYYAKEMMRITYIVDRLCCIAVILTMPISLSLYRLSGEALKLRVILALIHDGYAVSLQPSSFCLANVLRATSDVKFPMCVSILSMIIFRTGFSYLLAVGLDMGTVGVWWVMVADWSARSTLSGRRFASKK